MALYERFVMVSAEALDAFDADPVARAVLLELGRRAEWKAPRRVHTQHGPVDLDIGQLYFGRGELACKIGFSERRTRDALERLQSAQVLVQQTSSRGTIATLVGLKEKLSESRTERPAKRPGVRPPDSHPTSTTKIGDQDLPDLVPSGPEPPGHDGGRDRVHGAALPDISPDVDPSLRAIIEKQLPSWQETQRRDARAASPASLTTVRAAGDALWTCKEP